MRHGPQRFGEPQQLSPSQRLVTQLDDVRAAAYNGAHELDHSVWFVVRRDDVEAGGPHLALRADFPTLWGRLF